ncbi:zinc finger domain-containing protein [Streptomyces sp. NPDC002758]
MTRARPEGDPPTVDQIRHLIGHTERRALSPAESARLRAGVEHLIASQAGQAAQVTRLTRLLAAGSRPALDVDCPTCQAPARSACVTRFGQPTSAPHSLRLASAALPAADRNPS